MAKFSRRSLALLPFLIAGSAQATQPLSRKDAATKACSMSASLIAMRLVDAKGAPVAGASMQVRRLSGKRLNAEAGPFGSAGDYKVLEGAEVPDLQPEGEAFEVEFQKDGRSKRVRLRVGLDATGCHVKLLEGESRVVF